MQRFISAIRPSEYWGPDHIVDRPQAGYYMPADTLQLERRLQRRQLDMSKINQPNALDEDEDKFQDFRISKSIVWSLQGDRSSHPLERYLYSSISTVSYIASSRSFTPIHSQQPSTASLSAVTAAHVSTPPHSYQQPQAEKQYLTPPVRQSHTHKKLPQSSPVSITVTNLTPPAPHSSTHRDSAPSSPHVPHPPMRKGSLYYTPPRPPMDLPEPNSTQATSHPAGHLKSTHSPTPPNSHSSKHKDSLNSTSPLSPNAVQIDLPTPIELRSSTNLDPSTSQPPTHTDSASSIPKSAPLQTDIPQSTAPPSHSKPHSKPPDARTILPEAHDPEIVSHIQLHKDSPHSSARRNTLGPVVSALNPFAKHENPSVPHLTKAKVDLKEPVAFPRSLFTHDETKPTQPSKDVPADSHSPTQSVAPQSSPNDSPTPGGKSAKIKAKGSKIKKK